MSLETNRTPEKRNNKPNHTIRRFAALGLIGALGATGGAKMVNAVEGEHEPMTPHEYALQVDGFVDENAKIVTVEEGGKFRSRPDVTEDSAGTTNLEDVTDKAFVVPVDGNVVISHSVDGDWVSMAAKKVREANPDLDINGDWVSISTQRADVQDEEPTNLAKE